MLRAPCAIKDWLPQHGYTRGILMKKWRSCFRGPLGIPSKVPKEPESLRKWLPAVNFPFTSGATHTHAKVYKLDEESQLQELRTNMIRTKKAISKIPCGQDQGSYIIPNMKPVSAAAGRRHGSRESRPCHRCQGHPVAASGWM